MRDTYRERRDMSLKSLPPFWQEWTQEHLEDLQLEDLERAHALLRNRIYQIENAFLEETMFFDRNERRIMERRIKQMYK
jgi:hypothetical protein